MPEHYDQDLAMLGARPNVIITPHMAFLTQVRQLPSQGLPEVAASPIGTPRAKGRLEPLMGLGQPSHAPHS